MNCPHCQTPISDHPANRCFDAWVAEKVLGSKRPIYAHNPSHIDPYYSSDKFWVCQPDYFKGDTCEWLPIRFSTSIEAAWGVMDNIRNYIDLERLTDFGKSPNYEGGKDYERWEVQIGSGFCSDKSLPLAICKAALKAVSNA